MMISERRQHDRMDAEPAAVPRTREGCEEDLAEAVYRAWWDAGIVEMEE
jgi:hypothetical protein